MERIGKYENFPVLEAGDVVICGNHVAYIATGEGGYRFLISDSWTSNAVLCGHVDCFEKLFDTCYSGPYPAYNIPEAVFRRSSGCTIPSSIIPEMMVDWRSVNTANIEEFRRIWSIDDDSAKELTVDEVSKLLGYKVKIVGSGSAE